MQGITTRTVARVCQVAPRTVDKWLARGRLKGQADRFGTMRVAREELARFLQSHAMNDRLANLPTN
jgi:two-component system, OmpR family, response regulator RpaA